MIYIVDGVITTGYTSWFRILYNNKFFAEGYTQNLSHIDLY